MQDTITNEFIRESIRHFDENTEKIEACLNELNDAEIWDRPNTSSNSIGNLILHLCGNITQYVISSLGETEDVRNRREEFELKDGYSKHELMKKLKNVVQRAKAELLRLSNESLTKKRSVQGFNMTGTGIVLHVVEHYSYHTGQIVSLTKLRKDIDLGFYSKVDLNKKNRTE